MPTKEKQFVAGQIWSGGGHLCKPSIDITLKLALSHGAKLETKTRFFVRRRAFWHVDEEKTCFKPRLAV
jgi:hypothetical protein